MTDAEVPQRWTTATTYPDMWVDPDDDPREAGPPPHDERSTLVTYLRRYRLTLELTCADLDATGLAARSVPPSSMSLLGIVRHLADVERTWFRRGRARAARGPRPPRRGVRAALGTPTCCASAWTAASGSDADAATGVRPVARRGPGY